jgi:clathrin heavy chain
VCTSGDKGIQLFDFDIHVVLKSFLLPEELVFWKWVSPTCLGVVTATSVYHWVYNAEYPGWADA